MKSLRSISIWLEPAGFLEILVGEMAFLSYDYEQPTKLFRKSKTGETNELMVESHDVRFDLQMEAFD